MTAGRTWPCRNAPRCRGRTRRKGASCDGCGERMRDAHARMISRIEAASADYAERLEADRRRREAAR